MTSTPESIAAIKARLMRAFINLLNHSDDALVIEVAQYVLDADADEQEAALFDAIRVLLDEQHLIDQLFSDINT